MPPLSHHSASGKLRLCTRCTPGGLVFTLRNVLLLLRLGHHLRITLIQVKLTVHFLLLHTKFAQAFFMLKGSVKLLPVIRECLFLAFTFGLFFFGKTVKAVEGVFNTGYRAQSVLRVQVRSVGLCATQMKLWSFTFSTAKSAHDGKAFVVAKVFFPPVSP